MFALALWQAGDNQSYWLAFDWLVIIAIVALSYATAWATYRFWLSGWVRSYRAPFHLRLFSAIVGLGIFLIVACAYIFEYKEQRWSGETFLMLLGGAVLLW